MLGRIFSLIYKEILAVWRDKKSRIVLIVPPIFQLFIFALAATLDVHNVSIGILNRDSGEQGFELVQRFHGSPIFTHITNLQSVYEITPFIDNQKGVMVLSLDEQFSRNLDAAKPASVQLILDGRKSNAAQIVAGYASLIVDRFNKDFAAKTRIKQQNVELFPRFWFNPNLIYYWYNVPCLSGVLSMLVGLIVTSLSVARERELGTFDQLLVSPLTPPEILIGKTIPALIIGTIEGVVAIMVGIFIFQIPFTGNFFYLFLGLVVFISSIVGVGLFISALCSTQQQAILGTFVFMTPAVTLSGFATPIENMPDWLQTLTYLNPLRYYLIIAKGVFLKDMPFHMVLDNIWPLIIIAVVNMIGADLFFRRRFL